MCTAMHKVQNTGTHTYNVEVSIIPILVGPPMCVTLHCTWYTGVGVSMCYKILSHSMYTDPSHSHRADGIAPLVPMYTTMVSMQNIAQSNVYQGYVFKCK
jgi:hypothetical protein